MRSAFVALLVSTSFLLAGCSDDGGHEHETFSCPDGTTLNLEDYPDHDNATFNPLSKCPKRGGSTTSTSSAPNQMPNLVLTITDDGGNETPVTLLNGNLTFSAEGSADPDGQVTGIAVSVTDSNTTRTASLYDAASRSFKPATFKFDRPGVVNVTVAMVDDRAGFTTNQTHVYVNHAQVLQSQTIALGGGANLPTADTCTGSPGLPDGNDIISAAYFKPYSFTVMPNATFVEATATVTGQTPVGGTAVLTICAPTADGYTPVSDTATGSVTTNAAPPLPTPTGTQSYRVGVFLEEGSEPNASIAVSVVVHYEPQGAAAAQ